MILHGFLTLKQLSNFLLKVFSSIIIHSSTNGFYQYESVYIQNKKTSCFFLDDFFTFDFFIHLRLSQLAVAGNMFLKLLYVLRIFSSQFFVGKRLCVEITSPMKSLCSFPFSFSMFF